MQNAAAASTRSSSSVVWPIAQSPLLSGLNAERRSLLDKLQGPQRRAERDDQLVAAHDRSPPIVTLVRGWAFRYALLPDGRRQILSFCLPGDTPGLDNLLTGLPAYPLQAASSVVYSTIAHARATMLVRECSWFHDIALKSLARERADAESALARIGQSTAEECLANVLVQFYRRLAARGLASDASFVLQLTQQHLADYAGLTLVHLNRVLGRLRGRRLVAMSGHRITLLDIPALERLGLVEKESSFE